MADLGPWNNADLAEQVADIIPPETWTYHSWCGGFTCETAGAVWTINADRVHWQRWPPSTRPGPNQLSMEGDPAQCIRKIHGVLPALREVSDES